ncbi:nickel ABC transporter ATP-binding protein [Methanobrevibacter sp. 87.7]|uniref:ATP-binding cassette domain-containing protein n=1 Tax=Methanobrevibacter sp. 87.7 TaxID=387957 RepID=UPI000B506F74|nr:ATP-binding cassette domain-containing protein [Methanobrevibacter sp. 87.7]OWT33781.1 nickel ABC transporter ATP-binding protein [Methanobrevibacter sp. 87.7]
METLKAEHISFGYNSKNMVLNDINFTMDNSMILGLFGDSGSGKSTFCKILTGFIDSYKGNVLLNNKSIENGFNPIQLIYQHPEKIMNPRWNMGDILKESWNPSEKILNEFGIKREWFNRYPSELSGGELQRFSILRALNPKTKFIIADEITTMLDAVTQVQIWDSLLKYAKKYNIGVLVVSHDDKLLNKITDRTILLDDLNKQ